MKRIKRILSLFLTLVMVFSTISANVVFAKEETNTNLTISISGSGTVTVSDGNDSKVTKTDFSSNYPVGSAIMIEIKADKGNQIKSVTSNGKEMDDLTKGATEYTCSYIADESEVSIAVAFEEQQKEETMVEETTVEETTVEDAKKDNAAQEVSGTHGEDKSSTNQSTSTSKKDDGTTKKQTLDGKEAEKTVDTDVDFDIPDIPVPIGDETAYLIKDGSNETEKQSGISLCTVDTSKVAIKQGGIINYASGILSADGKSEAKMTLKYVDSDGNNKDMIDGAGSTKWRMVYCLQYKKDYPNGECNYISGTGELNKRIVYCLTYGVQYWGETTTYPTYSTGNWVKDYAVTQYAIHALNREFTSGNEYANRDWVARHITDASVKEKVIKLVNDAMTDSFYEGFNGSRYVGFKYSISPATQSGWSSYSVNGQAGYITNASYVQDYKDTVYTSKSKPWYIKYIGSSVSGVSGAQIVWDNNTKSWSSFKIWVPKASYETAQNTGATVTANISTQIPGYLSAWKYNPPASNMQISTFYEGAEYQPKEASVTATIAKVVRNGTLNITKVSSDTVLVKDNNNYSLKNAVFKVYKKGTNTEVKTLTTDANGKASASIAAGTYDVVEVTAPQGYVLDSTRHEVTITSGGTANLSVKNTPKTGKINLAKSSSKPEYTDNNSVYSLKDAVYTVYKKGTKTEVGKITTDKDGKGSLDNLAIGSYDVVETTAPKGFALDATTHSVTVNETNNSVVTIDLKVKDIPQLDPVGVMLKKVDADTMEAVPAGAGTLAGAEFTVKYYDVENYTTDPALDGKKAVRTWVVKTNDKGITRLRDDLLVSGDEFYLDSTGVPTLPLGTITIQESKAPEGYLLNEEVFIIPITSDGTAEGVNTYAIPTIPENALSLNLKKIQSGTDKAISGAVFEHTKPDGTTETMTTDENGELSFAGLAWGEHTVKEISVPDGYSVNTNEIKFTVSEGNVISINSKATETDTNGNVTVTVNKDGNIDAVVEEKPAPYKLRVVKYNDKEKVLSGAEFTLYAEEECNTVVSKSTTDENGVLTLENLIPGKHYYLKETKAPQGYKLPEHGNLYDIYVESTPVDGVFDFTVNGEKFTADSTDTTKNIYLSGSKADRVINMKIVNKIGLLLPETGSNMTLIVIAIGAVLMIFGMVFNKEKKKNKREEKEV